MDYASTTPVLPEVVSAMEVYWNTDFFNASGLYRDAVSVASVLSDARKTIASAIGGQARDIIYTASGTEANNLALLGLRNSDGRFDGVHIITSVFEHPSIGETCAYVESLGGEVTYVSVDAEGIVQTRELLDALRPTTRLVSVMMVNNEIGTIQPIRVLVRMVRKAEKEFGTRIYIHTDASQALNYLPVSVQSLGVDMMTLDASKIYGPKGIGLLYKKDDVPLKPLVFGGGQEQGVRSATEATPLIVGFAQAVSMAVADRETETPRLEKLRDDAISRILSAFPAAELNGSPDMRIANNINICFPGLDAEYAVIRLDYGGIQCSFASSCSSLVDDTHSVSIKALGKTDCASSSLRFTLGRHTQKGDIDVLLKQLHKIVL